MRNGLYNPKHLINPQILSKTRVLAIYESCKPEQVTMLLSIFYPVAKIVLIALKRCKDPSSMFIAMTPRQTPASIIRSRAKYSMKYCVLYRKD